MEMAKQIGRSINWKYVVLVVAAVSLFYALTTPVIIDPLIAFMLAGVVPGTDYVIPPEFILLAIENLLLLTVVVVLVRWLFRRRRVPRQFVPVVEPVVPEIVTPIAQTPKIHFGALVGRAVRRGYLSVHGGIQRMSPRFGEESLAMLVGRTFGIAGWLAIAGTLYIVHYFMAMTSIVVRYVMYGVGLAVLGLRFVFQLMMAGVKQILALLAQAAKAAFVYGTWTFVFIIVVLGIVIDHLASLSKRLWKKSKPGLQRFDTWLEMQYREFVIRAQQRMKQSDSVQALGIVARDGATTVRELLHK